MPRATTTAVVLNWRDTERTERCLKSLLLEDDIHRVVLVDNESEGLLRGIAESSAAPKVQLLELQENLGFSAGVNHGIRAAFDDPTQFLLIINNDAELVPGSLSELVRCASSHSNAGLLAPLILNPDGTRQSSGEFFNPWSFAVKPATNNLTPTFLTWACVLIPRRTLDVVGLLDETFFMYWEDTDYGLRCLAEGLDLVVVETARVVHEISSSHAKANRKIDLYSMLGVARLARKLGGRAYLGLLVRFGARFLRRALRRDFKGAFAVACGLVLGLRVERNAAVLVGSFLRTRIGRVL